MDSNLLLCRPGFEGDAASELESLAADMGIGGYARAPGEEGYLTFHAPGQDLSPVADQPLVFARTRWWLGGQFGPLLEQDRVSDLLALLPPEVSAVSLRLEHPDTNDGRGLQRFLKGFRKPLEAALARSGRLTEDAARDYLHFFFVDSLHGYWGFSGRAMSGPWENGIPRLRLAGDAPSRSALKLEEAVLRLFREPERALWLSAGREAVDLGAAPGGWSWFLARNGLRVTAVDHGSLADGLDAEYPVTHIAADAFTWRPPRPVDWVVCDVVDKPARTLSQIEKWLVHGWARLAVFNLKLPMKRRFAEVQRLLRRLESSLLSAGVEADIRAAHLYHDREEITIAVIPVR